MSLESKRKKVQKSLLDQLRLQNADTSVFSDLIHDYMALWLTKESLFADIEERGSVIEGKTNPAIKEAVGVNRQMLQILKELNLTTNNIAGEVDDL